MVGRRKKPEIRREKNKIKEENKKRKKRKVLTYYGHLHFFRNTCVLYMHKITNSIAGFKLHVRPSLTLAKLF